MATSRDFNENQQSLRPSRIRRIPGHLDDFVLTSQPQHLVSPPLQEDLQHMHVSETITDPDVEYGTSTPYRPDTETTRLRKVEESVWNVQEQLRELQSTLKMSIQQSKGSPCMHQDLSYVSATGAGHHRSVPHPSSQQQSIQQRSVSLPLLCSGHLSSGNIEKPKYYSPVIPARLPTTNLPQPHSLPPVQMTQGLLPQTLQPLSRTASLPIEHHVQQRETRPGSAPAGVMHPPDRKSVV